MIVDAMTDRHDAACERRIREYQSELAARVVAGEITDAEANELAANFQDRVMTNGAWD